MLCSVMAEKTSLKLLYLASSFCAVYFWCKTTKLKMATIFSEGKILEK